MPGIKKMYDRCGIASEAVKNINDFVMKESSKHDIPYTIYTFCIEAAFALECAEEDSKAPTIYTSIKRLTEITGTSVGKRELKTLHKINLITPIIPSCYLNDSMGRIIYNQHPWQWHYTIRPQVLKLTEDLVDENSALEFVEHNQKVVVTKKQERFLEKHKTSKVLREANQLGLLIGWQHIFE